jgi:ribosomal protein L25 (general stress protein Ctc)
MINTIIKTFLVLGTFMYGAAFVYSFTAPESIEKNARGFIKEQVAKKTHEKIDNIGSKYKENKLVKLSAKIFKKKKEQLVLYKESLKLKIDEKLANVMAKMLDLNCECREKYKGIFHNFITTNITDLQTATKKLETFMTAKYMYVVENIIKDFRIFLGSSFISLLIMLLLLFAKPQASIQVNMLAGFMLISTVVSSYLYIFKQNWFYTIIYNDFVGFAYLMYLGIIFLFLCDIIFNKARITTEIVNMILNAIGSSLTAFSC